MEIVTIETSSLGDRSYVVVSEGKAAAVDPQRDIGRVLRLVDQRHLTLTHVFETHIHNDYVTGGLELARRTGAQYVVSAADHVDYDRTPASDGDEFEVGAIKVRALHTPGHTPTHLSYAVIDGGSAVAVFTGGSMLYGTVGRTDLISADATEELTRSQFRSVRRLARELPSHAAVHPTHGFGSFCSSASTSGVDHSTIGREEQENLALTVDDEDRFVDRLLAGLTAYPRYYAHMAPINRAGPTAIDLSPPEPLDPVEIKRRIHAGEWVVDLRSRKAFAAQHLRGTISMEVGDSFVTYLGWTLPWGRPVTLVGDTAEEILEAQTQMARIGIDRPAGAATGGLHRWAPMGELSSYPSVSFADVAEARTRREVIVVDVRRDDEWKEGHIAGAVHVPLHDLEQRLDEIPEAELWVHCASGYRASIAASLLARAGRNVVVIDDEWERAAELASAGADTTDG